MKRLFLISALTVIALAFVSCNNVYTETDNCPETVSKSEEVSGTKSVDYEDFTAEEWLDTMETVNYGGESYTIATSKTGRFVSESDTGTVNPAIEKRNKLTESKFNIKIREMSVDESTIVTKMVTEKNAGFTTAELVSLSAKATATLASNGVLMNLYSVPFFNTNADYIDKSMLKAVTANDYAYMLIDNLSLFQQNLWCVYFNVNLVGDDIYNEIYTVVKAGGWTYEKLDEYAKSAAAATLNKRSPDLASDIFGLAGYFETEELVYGLFVSSGNTLFGDTFHKELSYTLSAIQANGTAKTISDIINAKYTLSLKGEDASKAFLEGRCAFFINTVGYAEALADSDIEWGIVPLPKTEASAENYHSYIGENGYGISVPVNQSDPEKVGRVLSALCATSYPTLKKALYDNIVTFCLSENEEAEMLEIIFDNPITDIGGIYSSGFDRLKSSTVSAVYDAVVKGTSMETLYLRNSSIIKAMNVNEFR